MFDPGESLSAHKNLEFLSAQSPEELKRQLTSIKLPYRLVSVYAQGGAHFAWIVPTQPIKKITKSKGDKA